ncbi:hypothetical protein NLX83_08695 [Allokutzneria sp. A3M-2-11 16]|uniref:hypothetical protein n=1 Tax=Allokutzneria sp. A3M-2-11 16 TaxID=2962043 RepID=UPI0020B674D2|nr:hypothetical protein [Allokutzneria sp. A3M-2-11 16]MCP3799330.1 hypothetical protein [Allokutzneria sp. A3M-2-11 16]
MTATNDPLRFVVLDVNVYLDAVLHDDAVVLGSPPNLANIPSLPPRLVHPALHVLGIERQRSVVAEQAIGLATARA